MIGSMVRALIILVPVFIAALVILARAVIPTISNAEKRELTCSIPADTAVRVNPFAADAKLLRPSDAFLNFNFSFNLSMVDIL